MASGAPFATERSSDVARAKHDNALRQTLYGAQMQLAQQSWEEGDLERARELLDAWRPRCGEEDVRGFEWRYLWGLCQGDSLFTLPAAPEGIA